MRNRDISGSDRRLLTVEQAADLLGIGRTTRISREKIDRFVRSLDRPEPTLT